MSESEAAPQQIQLQLTVALGTQHSFDNQAIAYYQAQPAPQIHGVDATLFGGDTGTAIA
jgi:hypothetical protein